MQKLKVQVSICVCKYDFIYTTARDSSIPELITKCSIQFAPVMWLSAGKIEHETKACEVSKNKPDLLYCIEAYIACHPKDGIQVFLSKLINTTYSKRGKERKGRKKVNCKQELRDKNSMLVSDPHMICHMTCHMILIYT